MVSERQPDIRLTGIHINLVDQVVTLESQDGRTAKLSFGEPKTLFDARPPADRDLPPAPETLEEFVAEPEEEAWDQPPEEAAQIPSSPAEPSIREAREKQQTVVVSGRLRTQPKQGRPDGKGRPTAWARLAVHEEDSEQAHLYGATFHRKTAEIALGLSKGAQLTVEGYPHAGDPARKRMDTFSVIAIHRYPGKDLTRPKTMVRRG